MNFAVIMAGGRGTRFWPKSRLKAPKQFLNIYSDQTMLDDTVDRLKGVVPIKNTIVVTNEAQLPALAESKAGKKLQQRNILAEPCGRNTAPCLGWASIVVRAQDKKGDGVVVALPADAVIRKDKKFQSILTAAIKTAQTSDAIVTLGIEPIYPETGYGYIELDKKPASRSGRIAHSVKRFVEKPNATTAKKYVRQGRFFWNAGIFVFRHEVMLNAIKEHLSKLYDELMVLDASLGKRTEKATLKKVFNRIKPVSIDYGIMEKFPNVKLHIADIGWNDLGSWLSLGELMKKDAAGNAVKGEALFIDAQNNTVSSDKPFVSLLGVDDLVVVATDDAILVTRKDRSQDVKDITTVLGRKKRADLL